VINGCSALLVQVFRERGGNTRSAVGGTIATPDYQPPAGTEKADEVLHNILVIGGFIEIATQPFWSALIGLRLLKMGSLVTRGVTSERAA